MVNEQWNIIFIFNVGGDQRERERERQRESVCVCTFGIQLCE